MGMLTDYVQVGKVREYFPTTTSSDYDSWMSDDSGPASIEEHIGEDWYKRRDAAKERATEENQRRKQVRKDIDANTARSKANASSIDNLNKEPDDPAPTPEANLQQEPETKPAVEEDPGVFNEPAAQEAKAKAQSYQAKKGGFQAGDLSSIKSTMSTSSATDSDTSAQAVYGNVSPAEAANEHANNLLTNYKSGIKYGSQKQQQVKALLPS